MVRTPGAGGGTPALGSVTYSAGGSSRAASPNGALGAGGISGGGSFSSGGSAEAVAGGTGERSTSFAGNSSAYDASDDGRFADTFNRLNPTDVARSGSIRFSEPLH